MRLISSSVNGAFVQGIDEPSCGRRSSVMSSTIHLRLMQNRMNGKVPQSGSSQSKGSLYVGQKNSCFSPSRPILAVSIFIGGSSCRFEST
jgi:hypothetical protein